MITSITIYAQSPQKIKYQAVVRDSDGKVLPNQTISLRIKVLSDSENGNPVYIETHKPATNRFGLINLEIGAGEVVDGALGSINWGATSYFLSMEIDIEGGTNYKKMGTSQILAVPIAMYAEHAGNVDDADADPQNEIQHLSLINKSLTISNGNTIDLADLKDDDADPTNEIQQIELDGTILSIDKIKTPSTVNLDAFLDNTDEQVLLIERSGNQIKLSISNGNSISFSDEINDADSDPENEIQDLQMSNNKLTITKNENASQIDLLQFLDNTDSQELQIDNYELTITGGNTITLPQDVDDADADATNEIQDLNINGNILTITDNNNPTPIDLSRYYDNTDAQTLSINNNNLSISGGNTIALQDEVNDADADPNNEIQDLNIENNQLSISRNENATTIDLSGYLDNTDNQTLFFFNNRLTIANGNEVDLTGLVNDPDADPQNEIQDLQLSDNTLIISKNGNATSIDLSKYLDNTDEQTLSFVEGNLSISNGNTITIPDNTIDDDADPQNELQNLYFINDTITITNIDNPVSVDMTKYLDNTDEQHLTYTDNILSISNGNSVEIVDNTEDADANPQNEIQDLSINNHKIRLTNMNNPTEINLLPYIDNTDEQTLQLNGYELNISNGNSVTLIDSVADADADPENELQNLTFNNQQLSIDNIANPLQIDMSQYMDNTDQQTLLFSGNELSISGGNTIALSVDDADANSTNEIQDIQLIDQKLSLSMNPNATQVDMSVYLDNTDNQTLEVNDHTLTISNGNSVTLPDLTEDGDADPENEIQGLELSNDQLQITGQTDFPAVDLTPYKDNTDEQQLQFANSVLSITQGNAVNLSSLVEDDDADNTNELITSGEMNGTELTIHEGSSATNIDLSATQILTSPGGDKWQLSVDDNGNLSTKQVVIDSDGNIYQTVTIGTQTWMSENLKVQHTPDNQSIVSYAYNDNENNVDTYGRLYTWDVAMNSSTTEEAQGVCPDGWHIPSDSEWSELISNYPAGQAGKALKTGGSSGFNALLSGARYSNGSYYELNISGTYWSSTENGSGQVYCRYFYTGDEQNQTEQEKDFAYSIRCVKD